MQQSLASAIIFLYIFISAALLLFSLAYMLSSNIREVMEKRRKAAEVKEQKYVLEDVSGRAGGAYNKKLYKKIRTISGLLAYEGALKENCGSVSDDQMAAYVRACRPALFDAAEVYRKRPAMERAFFAYVISEIPAGVAREFSSMGQILLDYLNSSTIYCRENVLKALYRLGSINIVEHALLLLQENNWYHNPKLISDGMTDFSGDREALARRLWKGKWNGDIKTALIQYMNNLPEDLSGLVLPELSSSQTEVAFAAVRYFGRHVCKESQPILVEILKKGSNLSAVAAQALGSYPEEGTKEALKCAVKSRNWNVRRNAAEALLKMNLSEEEVEQLCANEDRYAREMFVYVLESRGKTR